MRTSLVYQRGVIIFIEHIHHSLPALRRPLAHLLAHHSGSSSRIHRVLYSTLTHTLNDLAPRLSHTACRIEALALSHTASRIEALAFSTVHAREGEGRWLNTHGRDPAQR